MKILLLKNKDYPLSILDILLKKSTLRMLNVDFLLDLSEIFAQLIWIGKLNLSH